MEDTGVDLVNNWLYYSFYIIYFITILSTVVVVISENRNPVKTIAWVVVLLFLPIIGIVFYFFFGQDFTKYRPHKQQARNPSESFATNQPELHDKQFAVLRQQRHYDIHQRKRKIRPIKTRIICRKKIHTHTILYFRERQTWK